MYKSGWFETTEKVQDRGRFSVLTVRLAYSIRTNPNKPPVGHLFQDRFKSEPVENDAYFLTVLRYIHQNPVKAGFNFDVF